MNLKETLKSLEDQLKQAETLYLMRKGAIEIVKSLIEEENSKKKEKK